MIEIMQKETFLIALEMIIGLIAILILGGFLGIVLMVL